MRAPGAQGPALRDQATDPRRPGRRWRALGPPWQRSTCYASGIRPVAVQPPAFAPAAHTHASPAAGGAARGAPMAAAP